MDADLARLFSASHDTDPVADVAGHLDRREHARSIKVMRVARLKDIRVHAECLGLVRDVSPGGMMIDALFPLEVGQSISIALLDDQELTGEIMWRDGTTVGVQFTSEIPVDDILAKPTIKKDGKRTRLPRFKACKPIILNCESKAFEAVLSNISQRGAKILSDAKPRMNSNVLIRLNSAYSVAATVKWRTTCIIGVEFHRPLPVAELAKWIAAD